MDEAYEHWQASCRRSQPPRTRPRSDSLSLARARPQSLCSILPWTNPSGARPGLGHGRLGRGGGPHSGAVAGRDVAGEGRQGSGDEPAGAPSPVRPDQKPAEARAGRQTAPSPTRASSRLPRPRPPRRRRLRARVRRRASATASRPSPAPARSSAGPPGDGLARGRGADSEGPGSRFHGALVGQRAPGCVVVSPDAVEQVPLQ